MVAAGDRARRRRARALEGASADASPPVARGAAAPSASSRAGAPPPPRRSRSWSGCAGAAARAGDTPRVRCSTVPAGARATGIAAAPPLGDGGERSRALRRTALEWSPETGPKTGSSSTSPPCAAVAPAGHESATARPAELSSSSSSPTLLTAGAAAPPGGCGGSLGGASAPAAGRKVGRQPGSWAGGRRAALRFDAPPAAASPAAPTVLPGRYAGALRLRFASMYVLVHLSRFFSGSYQP